MNVQAWCRSAATFLAPAPTKAYLVRPRRALVSFTFDNATSRMLADSSEILLRHGMLGTYYYAAGVIGGSPSGEGGLCDEDDLRALIRQGHEIGCLTYSNLNCQASSREEILRDMDRNADYFRETFAQRLTTFAYPGGHLAKEARFAAGDRYSCARGLRDDINRVVTDLTDLSAVKLDPDSDPDRVEESLAEAKRCRGWLIFELSDLHRGESMHDLFEHVVGRVSEGPFEALPVRHALGAIAFQK